MADGFITYLDNPHHRRSKLMQLTPKERELRYPGGLHIGFILESEEQVNAINQRLREDVMEVEPPARLHGSWTFYVRAPGGFAVEVLC